MSSSPINTLFKYLSKNYTYLHDINEFYIKDKNPFFYSGEIYTVDV